MPSTLRTIQCIYNEAVLVCRCGYCSYAGHITHQLSFAAHIGLGYLSGCFVVAGGCFIYAAAEQCAPVDHPRSG
jgi:hypothetical protein